MGFDINPDGIRSNADSLRGICEEFGSIGESGKSTQLGWDVFGFLGRPFAWGLGSATKAAGSGIEAYGQIIGHTAEQLGHAADHIDARDQEASDYLAQ
jgi:hypothetical protein